MKNLFQRKPPAEPTLAEQKRSYILVPVFAIAVMCVVVVLAASGGFLIHQSNTNPNLCGSCHVMQPNVQSYLTSKNLDHVHEQAGVACKDCHDYPVQAEIASGVNYLTGNYFVNADGTMPKRTFDDAMCLKCHISPEHLANKTDFLARNPHFSHWGDLKCADCHVSHGQQINLCAECHDSGGQRMTGGEIFPRAENPWADPNRQRPASALPTAEPTPAQ